MKIETFYQIHILIINIAWERTELFHHNRTGLLLELLQEQDGALPLFRHFL